MGTSWGERVSAITAGCMLTQTARILSLFSFFGTLSLVSHAGAVERYCKVTAIYDKGFLEGALSVKEHPDVVVSLDEVVLGTSLFSVEKGDSIKEVISMGVEKNIDVKQAGGEVTYFLNINNLPTNKTGTLSGQIKGESASKIADLDCK